MSCPAARLLLAAQAALVLSTSANAATLLLPAVDTPTGGGGSVVLEPVKRRAHPTHRLIYSCVAPGSITYSDRPCGPLPEVRELKLAEPGAAAAGAPPETGKADEPTPVSRGPAKERDTAGAVAATGDGETNCQQLQATIDRLDARMRAGYSAREAGSLWDRWRDAKARLRAANC